MNGTLLSAPVTCNMPTSLTVAERRMEPLGLLNSSVSTYDLIITSRQSSSLNGNSIAYAASPGWN